MKKPNRKTMAQLRKIRDFKKMCDGLGRGRRDRKGMV